MKQKKKTFCTIVLDKMNEVNCTENILVSKNRLKKFFFFFNLLKVSFFLILTDLIK